MSYLSTDNRDVNMPSPLRICLLLLMLLTHTLRADELMTNWVESPPVIRTGVPHATRDKPQSKLWHRRGQWRAWLPSATGSAIWLRTSDGWKLETPLSSSLEGLIGHADVWADDENVYAILSARDRLTLVHLRYDADRATYRFISSSVCQLEPVAAESEKTETATITRDGAGTLWVAYNRDSRIWVRRYESEKDRWSKPIALGGCVGSDDICAIASLLDRCFVVWSDQRHDAVNFVAHRNTDPIDTFQPIETIEQGNHTADDHINIAVAKDGTIFVATKNSVDQFDQPQLVLRVRDAGGRWQNLPYANRTAEQAPSRPIVLLDDRQERLLLVHTLYTARTSQRRAFLGMIECQRKELDLDQPMRPLLSAAQALNDATGCKQPLPPDAPWIVLASDSSGNVYEAELGGAKAEGRTIVSPARR